MGSSREWWKGGRGKGVIGGVREGGEMSDERWKGGRAK